MDYMLYPRLTALAEGGWTQNSLRDWPDYLARLKGHLPLLDKQEIHHRSFEVTLFILHSHAKA